MQQLAQWIFLAAMAVTMFGMGLGLTLRDFTQLFTAPKAVIAGCIAQIVLLPIVAVLVVTLFGLDGPLALGLILVAACPGGPSSNLLTAFAQGDLALSIILTAVSGVITIVTIPLVVNAASAHYMHDAAAVQLPVLQTMGQIFLVTLIPTALGMRVLISRPALAQKMEPWFRRFSLAFLMLLIAGALMKERAGLIDHVKLVGWPVVLTNVLAMALGAGLARALRLGRARAVAISIEVGIQNAVMAMGIALAMLQRSDVAVPAIVYAALMYFSAGAVVFVSRRLYAREAESVAKQLDPAL
jgi:BASS family bile acid:Na+ symporter